MVTEEKEVNTYYKCSICGSKSSSKSYAEQCETKPYTKINLQTSNWRDHFEKEWEINDIIMYKSGNVPTLCVIYDVQKSKHSLIPKLKSLFDNIEVQGYSDYMIRLSKNDLKRIINEADNIKKYLVSKEI